MAQQQYSLSEGVQEHNAPPLPPRTTAELDQVGQYLQPDPYPAPPHRLGSVSSTVSDVSSPIHYTRDPHKLVAYLVPFPAPQLDGIPADALPPRFLIYTPPPPPLSAPKEGEKETKVHKVQRKWQEEVRSAKNSDAKTASWKGIRSKATRGIDMAMSLTKNSNIEFLNRIGNGASDKHAEDGHGEGEETHRTVGLEEMCLLYPPSMNRTPDQLRQDFIDSMLRSKTKAQRDAIIATGLLPVSACIDILATLVWPFGGLLEIDGVWAAASIRGAKTSRSVTKRLTSSSKTGKHDEDTLRLTFASSPRLEILDRYLAAKCHDKNPKLFPSFAAIPTETDVLEAIGWSPSQTGGETKNWEDEQWETSEVKDDLKNVMKKGANEWNSWVKAYEKDPEKAMKK
ncbi:hypothetical protein MBLNU459_g1831t1 [Dothideomycetes sp. NU459]